ncbi:glycosyltransferase family 39 protein [Leptolyngbya sp. FACHB-261]|nr:glycosyltransferase family 39 protein [Leptolyngbya sp. FACHB-261]
MGIFFRFSNLDRKIYWHDEAYTSLRISGYTTAEFFEQVYTGSSIGIEKLQKYQNPSSDKDIIDTVKSLAIEDAQHPPFYYIILRLWIGWFGSSVTIIRSLSAVISLLAFPCVYWLCLELFGSSLSGWIAIILLAVSPFQIVYAQEAREYSLWAVTILVASLVFLKAVRLKTKSYWSIYAATVAMSLYTFLFSFFFLIGHGAYIIAIEKLRFNRTVRAYLLASFVGFLAFVPWFLVVIKGTSQISRTTSWMGSQETPPLNSIKVLAQNISLTFFDLYLGQHFKLDGSGLDLLLLPLLILIGYSFYFLYNKGPRSAWLFVVLLTWIIPLALILPDLLLGGRRSAWPRFIFPCSLGILLAVTYLFTIQISSIYAASSWRRRIWQIAITLLISGEVLSCAVHVQAQDWWNKYGGQLILETAYVVNQSSQPLLISDSSDGNTMGSLLSLSHLLEPKVKVQLIVEPSVPIISSNFSNIFLYQASEATKQKLKNDYEITPLIEPVYESGALYQLNRKNEASKPAASS